MEDNEAIHLLKWAQDKKKRIRNLNNSHPQAAN